MLLLQAYSTFEEVSFDDLLRLLKEPVPMTELLPFSANFCTQKNLQCSEAGSNYQLHVKSMPLTPQLEFLMESVHVHAPEHRVYCVFAKSASSPMSPRAKAVSKGCVRALANYVGFVMREQPGGAVETFMVADVEYGARLTLPWLAKKEVC